MLSARDVVISSCPLRLVRPPPTADVTNGQQDQSPVSTRGASDQRPMSMGRQWFRVHSPLGADGAYCRGPAGTNSALVPALRQNHLSPEEVCVKHLASLYSDPGVPHRSGVVRYRSNHSNCRGDSRPAAWSHSLQPATHRESSRIVLRLNLASLRS